MLCLQNLVTGRVKLTSDPQVKCVKTAPSDPVAQLMGISVTDSRVLIPPRPRNLNSWILELLEILDYTFLALFLGIGSSSMSCLLEYFE